MISVRDSSNNIVTIGTLPPLGSANTANSLPVTPASDAVFSTQLVDPVSGAAKNLYTYPDSISRDIVGTTRTLFSDDFGGTALDATRWDVYDGGLGVETINSVSQAAIGTLVTGITHSVSNSVLSIVMGTTANAEHWLLSKFTFAGSEDVSIVLSKTAALATNSLFIGMVEVDPVTGYPIKNPLTANEFQNKAGVEFGANTGTQNAYLQTIADGSPTVTSLANTLFAPAAMTTAFETTIEFNAEDIIASSAPIDTTTGKTAYAIRISSQVPNDNKAYKLLIRARNITSAPASSVTFNISRITVVDASEIRAEIKSGRGDIIPQKALAVNLAQGIPSGANTIGVVALGAGASTIGSVYPTVGTTTAAGAGLSVFRLLAAATTNATVVKASAGRLLGGQVYNAATTVRYLKLYNLTTAPVIGTSVPLLTITVPPSINIDLVNLFTNYGLLFTTGIGVGTTVNYADTDTTAVTASDLTISLLYI